MSAAACSSPAPASPPPLPPSSQVPVLVLVQHDADAALAFSTPALTPIGSVAPALVLPPQPAFTSTPVKGPPPPGQQPPATPQTPIGNHAAPAFETPIAAAPDTLDTSQAEFVTPDLERSHLDALATSMRSAAAFAPPSK